MASTRIEQVSLGWIIQQSTFARSHRSNQPWHWRRLLGMFVSPFPSRVMSWLVCVQRYPAMQLKAVITWWHRDKRSAASVGFLQYPSPNPFHASMVRTFDPVACPKGFPFPRLAASVVGTLPVKATPSPQGGQAPRPPVTWSPQAAGYKTA